MKCATWIIYGAFFFFTFIISPFVSLLFVLSSVALLVPHFFFHSAPFSSILFYSILFYSFSTFCDDLYFEICSMAVRQDWRALEYASSELKGDGEIVLTAIMQVNDEDIEGQLEIDRSKKHAQHSA